MFTIQHLDHVALRVRDIRQSAQWYKQILGLRAVHPKEWGPFPIFMVAGGTGIALFPTNSQDAELPPEGDWIKGHHYAFRVGQMDFERAKEHLTANGIDWEFQDHHQFHSIYFQDPDGHRLELTTQVQELEGM